jgi:hypothetical protein
MEQFLSGKWSSSNSFDPKTAPAELAALLPIPLPLDVFVQFQNPNSVSTASTLLEQILQPHFFGF